MEEYDEMIRVAIEAARAGGAVVARGFTRTRSVRFKGRANPVTDTDLKAEETIVDLIAKNFPEHNIITEEERSIDRGSRYTWIIDPMDGTMNFTMGIPFVAVSVALAVDNRPILGCVYDPLRKEVFTARQGKGAFLNGRRIAVSNKELLQDALLGFDLGYDEQIRQRTLEASTAIRPHILTLRLPGSAVLGMCYVACARFDVYFHPLIYPWDIAAGAVLVMEAGGQVTDLSGEDVTTRTSSIVASNPRLHEQFMELATQRLAVV
ncbi:MAG: inositol monophosphatase [Chloroflexi bacterium]|nr:inositol monophosphatase [Chloroflexota bacterium]